MFYITFRQLQKKVRAAQLMKSSSLPPSMARRERVKSTCARLQSTMMNENTENGNTSRLSSNTSIPLEGYRSMMSLLPLRGNNLAAILRCQVSRYYRTTYTFGDHASLFRFRGKGINAFIFMLQRETRT